MLIFYKILKISTKIMQRSRIIITYLILWTKFRLNGARIVNFGFGGEIFVFGEVGKWRLCVVVLLLTDLSNVAWVNSRYVS